MDTENKHIDPVGLLPNNFSGEAPLKNEGRWMSGCRLMKATGRSLMYLKNSGKSPARFPGR